MPQLSILIPARNEIFLRPTIDNILQQIRGDTEVIAVLDGYWPDPPILDDPRVTILHYTESIGQRAATNVAARLSKSKYLMKVDAHCAFDDGFDLKLIEPYETKEIGQDVTTVPRMYNLHAFNWCCLKCGQEEYQGPTPTACTGCDNTTDFERKLIWEPRWSRKTDFARFDHTLHFQYWGAYGNRPEADGDLADLMCCVGAGWFIPRKRYWEIDGMDEAHGSWGQMGVELACKSWLSGGRQIVNKRTWFAHMFRTQAGFTFPYPNPGVEKARAHSRALWFDGQWRKAKHPLSWMIEKFAPIPDWHDGKHAGGPHEAHVSGIRNPARPARPVDSAGMGHRSSPPRGDAMTKGIVYYTDNQLNQLYAIPVRDQLSAIAKQKHLSVVSVSLQPLMFYQNLVVERPRGVLTMFKQILAGLEALDTDIAYLCEHDVLYHPDHFDFTPASDQVYYYNEHTYKVDAKTGQAVFYYTKQTSGLCANRQLLVEHYRRRVAKVEQNARDLIAAGQPVHRDGYSQHMGYEPGCHTPPRGVDDFKAERWMAARPNVDIRHARNLTASRWSQDEFRDKRTCQGWTLVGEIPGWGPTLGCFPAFLDRIRNGLNSSEPLKYLDQPLVLS